MKTSLSSFGTHPCIPLPNQQLLLLKRCFPQGSIRFLIQTLPMIGLNQLLTQRNMFFLHKHYGVHFPILPNPKKRIVRAYNCVFQHHEQEVYFVEAIHSSIPCLDSPTSPVFDVAFLAFDSYSSDVLMLEKKLWH